MRRPLPRAVALLLPIIFPSWRFFAVIAPAPRVDVADLAPDADEPAAEAWRPLRPTPDRLSLLQNLKRVLWNPRWNETLFLTTCAERVAETGDAALMMEILRRAHADMAAADTPPRRFALRLTSVRREGDTLIEDELYQAPVQSLAKGPTL